MLKSRASQTIDFIYLFIYSANKICDDIHPPFFFSLFVNHLWTNPNTVTVYLICRHFHKLIPVFETFATSLLWIHVIWSSWWGTSPRVDTRNTELIQQSFCLEAEQFLSHSYKTKPGWKVISIWGRNKQSASSLELCVKYPTLDLTLSFFPSWIVPLGIIFKQKYQGHYLPDPVCTPEAQGSASGTVTAVLCGMFSPTLPCLSAAPRQKYKKTPTYVCEGGNGQLRTSHEK